MQVPLQLQHLDVQAGAAAVVGEAAGVAHAGVVNDVLAGGVEHITVAVLWDDEYGKGDRRQTAAAVAAGAATDGRLSGSCWIKATQPCMG